MTLIDKIVSPRSVIDDCKPTHFLQTAYQHVFTNLSLVSYTTVCSYQSLKENCVNASELPFNTLRNFVCCLTDYCLCLRIFFGWTKLRRKITLCSSELSLDMPWNFMWTFERTVVKKSCEQRTKFAHSACITFAQYCISWKLASCFVDLNTQDVRKKRFLIHDMKCLTCCRSNHNGQNILEAKWHPRWQQS